MRSTNSDWRRNYGILHGEWHERTLNRVAVMLIEAIRVNAIYRYVSELSARPAPPQDAGQ